MATSPGSRRSATQVGDGTATQLRRLVHLQRLARPLLDRKILSHRDQLRLYVWQREIAQLELATSFDARLPGL